MPKLTFKHTEAQQPIAPKEGETAQGPSTEEQKPMTEEVKVEERPLTFSERRELPLPRRYRGFMFNGG